jgi:hypothetical protein
MAIQENACRRQPPAADDTGRVDPPFNDPDDVTGLLNGRVVVSAGRGGPVQAAVNRALKAAGAVVMVKTSTTDILKMLAAFVPSVIVTEVVPGDDGGPAILRAVRALPPGRGGDVPVVGVSWETLDPAPIQRAGFQGALVGPFDAADVVRTVLKSMRQPF